MSTKTFRSVLATALAIGGIFTGLAFTAGTSAMAATTGNLVICAKGNYSGGATVDPINDGNGAQPADPLVANPGGPCRDVYYGTTLDTTLAIKVYGFYNDSGQRFYIGTEHFNPSYQGLTIDLLGLSTSPSLYAH